MSFSNDNGNLLIFLALSSVADINQELIDDGHVEKEKIGGSNYFWSFPAKKARVMEIQHEENLRAVDKLRQQEQEAVAKLADAKRGREDQDGERAKKLQRLSEMSAQRQKIEKELNQLKENDPQASKLTNPSFKQRIILITLYTSHPFPVPATSVADLEKTLKLATEAAHRWTDNIFDCKTYLTKKRGMDPKEVCKFLGITSSFDCK